MVAGLGHVAITASDIDRSLHFYCTVLGLPEAFRVHNDDGRLWMVYLKTGPRDFIELFAGGAPPAQAPGNAAGFKHLCLWVEDIEAALRDLKARGLNVDPNAVRTGRSGCRQYFIADPDGVRIELMQLMPDSLQARAIRTSTT